MRTKRKPIDSPVFQFYRNTLGDFGTMLALVRDRADMPELDGPADEWRAEAVSYRHNCMAHYADPLFGTNFD